MPVLYANNAASRLAASITNVATSFSVTAGHGAKFPAISGGDYFYATLMDMAGNLEVVKVTARATDTFTVTRAQEGTTARAYAVNDIVELRITKAMLDDFKTDTRAGNAATATALQTARTIGGVSFNGTANINLPGVNAAGNQSTTGNAATATALQTARTIGGVSFNGTANINLPGVNAAGNQNTTGSAATLTTARSINGTTFNGSANITTANWGTARDINGTSINGSANYAIGRIYDTNYRRITNPGGAEYVTGSSSITGAIAITLPVGMTGSMVRMTIKVYEYTTNESFEIHCGGYNYATGATWANSPFAYIVGNPSIDRRFTVRFGYDSGALKAIIYIGELASTWSYPQVSVTDVQVGYSGNAVTWTTGWTVGFEAAAFKAVTATISNCQVGYAVSTNTANSAVLRDGSGNFSAGTITAALTGNASTATALQTARTINGVSFNGTANITIPTSDSTKLPLTGGTVTGDLYSTARLTNTPTTGWSSFYLGGQYNSFAWFHVGGESGSNDLRIGRVNRSTYAWEANPFTFDLTGGNFTAGGNVTAYSDERLKKDWAPVATDFIERLAAVKSGTYTRIDSGERQAGASAQDMQSILCEVVSATSDESKTLSLAYGNAALVSAIELAKRLLAAEKEIAVLKELTRGQG